mmetsp:Transcript_1729/g.2545  ORF Transcript_1729/g.2545 Transcript_1729/m.2545 type:complete len:759 (-) Transcript_1729:8-2284(-)
MTNETQIRRLVVDLKRLLYRMETYNPDELSSYTLRGRAILANEMLVQLQELEHPGACELREEVKATSLKAEALATKKRLTEVDLIEIMFLESKRRSEPEEDLNDLADEVDQSLDETVTSTNEGDIIPKETKESQRGHYERMHGHDEEVEEIQKAQREQLEAEISHMASQLKTSTQYMNITLRGQTQNLQKMEDLAAENINKVGKAAENVQEHNKRAWSSTIATWTWLMIAIGLFVFCMVTIKMVPRRANACLFNCKDPLKMEKSASKRVEELKAQQRDIKLKTKQMEDELLKQKEKQKSEKVCESEAREGKEDQCNAHQDDNADGIQNTQTLKHPDNQESIESEKNDKKPKQRMQFNPHRHSSTGPKPRQNMDQKVSDDEKKNKKRPQMGLLNPHRQRQFQSGQMKQKPLLNPHRRRNFLTGERKQQMIMNRSKEGQEPLHGIDKKELEGGPKQNVGLSKREEQSHNETIGETMEKAEDLNEPEVDNERTELTKRGEVVMENTDLNTGGTSNELLGTKELNENDSLDRHVCESGECSAEASPEIAVNALDVHAATAKGDLESLRNYIQQAPHLATHADDNGWQPLHEAVFNTQQETTDYLLQLSNVDVNSKTKNGETAVWLSRHLQSDHPIVISLKLAGGVSIGSEDNAATHNTLDFTEFDVISSAKVGNNKLLLKYLDMKPEWVNFADGNGWTAMHEAIRGQHTSTVITLLERGGDANAVTGRGDSPLALALDYFGESHEITKQLRKFEAREIRIKR